MPRKKSSTPISSVGGRGHRVTICRRAGSPHLHLRWWRRPRDGETRGNWMWRSLKHNDEDQAIEEAKEVSAALLTASPQRRRRITLSELFAAYRRNGPAKGEKRWKEDRRRLRMWEHFLMTLESPVADPMQLRRSHLDRFVRERRAGSIEVPDHELSRRPGNRTIEADLQLLHAVLSWAEEEELISHHPVRRYRRPKEVSPRRPIASYDHFLAVSAVADGVDPQRLFQGFLGLVEALGWRVTAVCQLKGSDIDLARIQDVSPHGRILKRGDVDKEGVEAWVPLSADARKWIVQALERNPVLGDAYLFPAPRGKGKPWSQSHARQLHLRAQDKADVPRLGFHAYRRKWVTERKHLPRKDVAAAGGWRSERTLDIYEQLDPQTLLAVVEEPRKLRAVSGDRRSKTVADGGEGTEAPPSK